MRQRRHSKYYEAILQLRNPEREVIDFVEKEVKASGSPDIFISKREKVANGFDFYMSSNKFAVGLGRELLDKFGGELKVSKKLFSQHRQTSKLLYRMTVLFRMPPFKVGGIVMLDNQPLKITSLGKKVYVVNVENNSRLALNYSEVIQNSEKLEMGQAVVSKVKPRLEVIHPKMFQSIPVLPINKTSGLVPGQKIAVVFSGEKVWLAT